MKFLSTKYGFPPRKRAQKVGKTVQISRKPSIGTFPGGGGGERNFMDKNDFMDIWAFLTDKCQQSSHEITSSAFKASHFGMLDRRKPGV